MMTKVAPSPDCFSRHEFIPETEIDNDDSENLQAQSRQSSATAAEVSTSIVGKNNSSNVGGTRSASAPPDPSEKSTSQCSTSQCSVDLKETISATADHPHQQVLVAKKGNEENSNSNGVSRSAGSDSEDNPEINGDNSPVEILRASTTGTNCTKTEAVCNENTAVAAANPKASKLVPIPARALLEPSLDRKGSDCKDSANVEPATCGNGTVILPSRRNEEVETSGRCGGSCGGEASAAPISEKTGKAEIIAISPTIHRPNPVKTVPPVSHSGSGVARVAPTPKKYPNGVERIPAAETTNTQQNNSSQSAEARGATDAKNIEKVKSQLVKTTQLVKPKLARPCSESAAVKLQQREKEEKKKKRLELQRRQQEIQCNFPESYHQAIPPAVSGSGRDAADKDMNGQANNNSTSGQYATGQPGEQQQLPPKQVRISSSNGATSNVDRGMRSGSTGRLEEEAAGSNVASIQPTPLFERLVTEEVQELKAYARIIENQNRQLSELERVHLDLEARLEVESAARKQLEGTLESREREWASRFEDLEKDRNQWKDTVQAEQAKNSRLIDQVVRKDQDIHRMLQRKYDNEGLSNPNVRSIRASNFRREGSYERVDKANSGAGAATATRSPDFQTGQHHKSPHELLAASGSAEHVRQGNIKNLLENFFGM